MGNLLQQTNDKKKKNKHNIDLQLVNFYGFYGQLSIRLLTFYCPLLAISVRTEIDSLLKCTINRIGFEINNMIPLIKLR